MNAWPIIGRNSAHKHLLRHRSANLTAGRAEHYADKLLRQRGPWDTMGHLLHMPSHIYQRIGRYHDGVLANLLAFKADKLDNDNCRVPYSMGARKYP